VLVACHLGTALQSIISRNISAQDTAVLSITRIQSGDAYNVIPQSAVMAGTVRTMKSDVMATIEQNMKRLATSIAAGFGAEATVDFRVIFAPMVNNTEEAIAYGDAAAELVGEDSVRRDGPPGMGSEDFSFMMEKVPGAHINLGNGDTAALHNHLYDFNDETIPYGVALYAAITEKKLPKGSVD
jgi:hippurate hydrolase